MKRKGKGEEKECFLEYSLWDDMNRGSGLQEPSIMFLIHNTTIP